MVSQFRTRDNPSTATFPPLNDDIPPLRAMSINELLAKEFPPLQWIIPDILPEGLCLLFSRPKVGKSMVALALALRLARKTAGGVDGEVFYLSLDDTSERRLQSRVRSLLQGQEVQDKVWFATQSRSLDSGLATQLRYWMRVHPETRLIVVDVYGAVKPKRRGDDIYKNDYDALRALRDFAEHHHVAILLIHHTRKQVDTEDWINNVNGSTGLTGATDTLWMIERKRGSQDMRLLITGRDVEDATIDLTLDDLDAPWIIRGQDDKTDTATSRDAVVSVLTNAEPVSPATVATLTGLQPANAQQLLRRMLRRGQVEQTKYGLYRMPSPKTDTDTPYSGVSLSVLPEAPPESGRDGVSRPTHTRLTQADRLYFPARMRRYLAQGVGRKKAEELALLELKADVEAGRC